MSTLQTVMCPCSIHQAVSVLHKHWLLRVVLQVPDTRLSWSQTAQELWRTLPTVAHWHAFLHTSALKKVKHSTSWYCSMWFHNEWRNCDMVIGRSLKIGGVCVCVFLLEPVCAVGQGVSALCCATEGQKWIFSGYSLTGVGTLKMTQWKF